jgi:hypothetical protein
VSPVKKLIALAAVAALGYFAYTRLFDAPRSPEETEYRRISKAFDEAIGRYGQANRMAGVSGMDVTGDIGDIAVTVDALRSELAGLEARLTDEKVLAKARDLGTRMERFLSDKR